MLSAHIKSSEDRAESRLKERLDDLTTECDSLRSQVTRFKKEIEIHKSERAQLKETNDELTNKNKSLEEKNRILTDELNSFESIQNKLEDMNHINMKLKTDIIKHQQNTKDVDTENKNLRKQIEEYQLKSTQIERETRKQMMDNDKQREFEQNIKIQQLQDQVVMLESQLNFIKTRAMPTIDDDEKAPIITTNYLPALMHNKTLKVGDKTNKNDKHKAMFLDLYGDEVSTEPSISIPEPTDTRSIQQLVQKKYHHQEQESNTMHIYNHSQIGGYNGLPFAGIGSVESVVSVNYNEYIGDQHSDITSLHPHSIQSLQDPLSMNKETSASTIGGTVYLDGNDMNTNTNIAIILQQKQHEYNVILLDQRQKHEREIQELTERNAEKMMDLMKDIEELQSKKIEYENKIEIISKEYEQRIKIIKKEDDDYMEDDHDDDDNNMDNTKYQQLRKEIVDLKHENKKLKLRLANAWEICITPSWFASDNID